jgi:hypothetical protein
MDYLNVFIRHLPAGLGNTKDGLLSLRLATRLKFETDAPTWTPWTVCPVKRSFDVIWVSTRKTLG